MDGNLIRHVRSQSPMCRPGAQLYHIGMYLNREAFETGDSYLGKRLRDNREGVYERACADRGHGIANLIPRALTICRQSIQRRSNGFDLNFKRAAPDGARNFAISE
ncbi:unnamed protein product [Prorocentrum cordatum]|uniref:Uncharacterized protein n=1 Tax=Prorocentrum cordatum TaxID=2364126 RepID=A0ABN9T038_9DINO|nr:unnamed protein product [Polarella glacialis]